MNENWFEKIEEYLNGNLSHEEKRRFESEMASNEELSALVSVYRTIETEMRNNAKYSKHETSLKNSLEELNAAYFKIDPRQAEKSTGEEDNSSPENDIPVMGEENPRGLQEGLARPRKINVWKSLAVAAGMIGIIAIGITWYLQQSNDEVRLVTTREKKDSAVTMEKSDTIYPKQNIPNENLAKESKPGLPPTSPEVQDVVDPAKREALFAANFQADTVPGMQGGPLQEVYDHYESGEYREAIQAFNNVNTELVSRGDQEDKKLIVFYFHYYKGLSYMANKEVAKSIPSMEIAIMKSPDKLLQTKAQWYLSLAYLKTGQINKAEKILLQLKKNEQGGVYKQKATELLANLEEK